MKTRLLSLLGIQMRSKAIGTQLAVPQRSAAPMSVNEAVHLTAVYRALFILSTAMGQLSLDVERGGQVLEDVPAIIRRPSLHMTRREFVEALTIALATSGNAYIKVTKDPQGDVISLDPLNPWECQPVLDPKTGIKQIHYKGHAFDTTEIAHLRLMTLPGHLTGLGPIQAAQTELGGIRDVRDYAAKWFTDSGQPLGILTTEQKVTQDDLRQMRNAWNYRDADGNPLPAEDNPSRIRAMANGIKYQPLLINPKDAQWIEAQQFNTTQIARLFGIPAPLLLAAVEGNAQTYSNVEQEWLAFSRFTLAAYIRVIEDTLTDLSPRGQTVRFNIEALLRTDTKSRYEAHKVAIDMGLYDAAYARKIEGITL